MDRQKGNGTLTMNAPSLVDSKIGPAKSPTEVKTSVAPRGLGTSRVGALDRHLPDPALTVIPDDLGPTSDRDDLNPL